MTYVFPEVKNPAGLLWIQKNKTPTTTTKTTLRTDVTYSSLELVLYISQRLAPAYTLKQNRKQNYNNNLGCNTWVNNARDEVFFFYPLLRHQAEVQPSLLYQLSSAWNSGKSRFEVFELLKCWISFEKLISSDYLHFSFWIIKIRYPKFILPCFFFFFEFVKFGLTYDQLQCRLSGKSLVIRGDRLSSQNNLWWTSTGFPLFVCSSFWQVKGTFGPFFLQLKSSSRKKERCLLRKSAYISSFPQAEIFGTPLQSARF